MYPASNQGAVVYTYPLQPAASFAPYYPPVPAPQTPGPAPYMPTRVEFETVMVRGRPVQFMIDPFSGVPYPIPLSPFSPPQVPPHVTGVAHAVAQPVLQTYPMTAPAAAAPAGYQPDAKSLHAGAGAVAMPMPMPQRVQQQQPPASAPQHESLSARLRERAVALPATPSSDTAEANAVLQRVAAAVREAHDEAEVAAEVRASMASADLKYTAANVAANTTAGDDEYAADEYAADESAAAAGAVAGAGVGAADQKYAAAAIPDDVQPQEELGVDEVLMVYNIPDAYKDRIDGQDLQTLTEAAQYNLEGSSKEIDCLEKLPFKPLYRALLALSLWKWGYHTEAIRNMEECVTRDPKLMDHFLPLQEIRMKKGFIDNDPEIIAEAFKACEQKLKPDNIKLLNHQQLRFFREQLADLYYHVFNLEAALACYKHYCSIYKDDYYSQFHVAYIQYELGQLEESRMAFVQLLKVVPGFKPAAIFIDLINLKLKNIARPTKFTNDEVPEALRTIAAYPFEHIYQAERHYQYAKGQYDEAQRALEQLPQSSYHRVHSRLLLQAKIVFQKSHGPVGIKDAVSLFEFVQQRRGNYQCALQCLRAELVRERVNLFNITYLDRYISGDLPNAEQEEALRHSASHRVASRPAKASAARGRGGAGAARGRSRTKQEQRQFRVPLPQRAGQQAPAVQRVFINVVTPKGTQHSGAKK